MASTSWGFYKLHPNYCRDRIAKPHSIHQARTAQWQQWSGLHWRGGSNSQASSPSTDCSSNSKPATAQQRVFQHQQGQYTEVVTWLIAASQWPKSKTQLQLLKSYNKTWRQKASNAHWETAETLISKWTLLCQRLTLVSWSHGSGSVATSRFSFRFRWTSCIGKGVSMLTQND